MMATSMRPLESMNSKYYALQLAVKALSCVYAPMKLRRTKNRITIISRQSREQSLDVALLSDYLENNYPEAECKVMVKFIEDGLAGRIGYCFHMLSQMWAIAASKVLVLDGYCICASVLNHKQDLVIVQMWHALAAIKKFGYQALDKEGGRDGKIAEIMRMHHNYDYVLAPSETVGKAFCEGFNVDRNTIELLGLPRIDKLVEAREDNSETKKFRQKVRQEYGVADDQEIVLYAPTFRRGESVDVSSLINALQGSSYKLIVKLHPLYDEENISNKTYSTYEWLRVCDRVITDYSALGVEASVTGKPVYFYVYDIDSYKEQTGLNVDPLIEMPGASSKDAGELAVMMRQPYDYTALKEFRNKYISVETENCTQKLGDFIYGLTR